MTRASAHRAARSPTGDRRALPSMNGARVALPIFRVESLRTATSDSGRNLVTVDAVNCRRDPLRDRHAARADADERELVDVCGTRVTLENLMRDARKRLAHPAGIHHHRHRRT